MCADKPDQYMAHHELYQHYQPIVIALDIKHISLVTDTIHTVECLLDVSKAFPFSLFGFLRAVLDCGFLV